MFKVKCVWYRPINQKEVERNKAGKRQKEGIQKEEKRRAGGGNKKIKPMNELHAHYETKKPFEALSVRSSFMVKQEKASSLKR